MGNFPARNDNFGGSEVGQLMSLNSRSAVFDGTPRFCWFETGPILDIYLHLKGT